MRKVYSDFGAELRDFNGEDDDVHLLVEYPPQVSISACAQPFPGHRLGA